MEMSQMAFLKMLKQDKKKRIMERPIYTNLPPNLLGSCLARDQSVHHVSWKIQS